MIRAVIDTNVWISAILNPKGTPGQVRAAWAKNKFVTVTSKPLLQELHKVLHYEQIQKIKPISEDEINQMLSGIANTSHVIKVISKINVIEKDPEDNTVLATALDGAADYIVSGDKHLLELRKFKETKILNPVNFIKNLKTTKNIS